MVLSELMKSVSSMFKRCLDDKALDYYYCGNKEALQREFISCIQKEIGSDFVVLTKEELMERMNKWHSSMEGTDW
jgi:hypothetical protein